MAQTKSATPSESATPSRSPRRPRRRARAALALAALAASACATAPRFRSERVYHSPSLASQRAEIGQCQARAARCLERAAVQRERCVAHSAAGASCEGFADECRRTYDDCFTRAGGEIEVVRTCVGSCESVGASPLFHPVAPGVETAAAR